MVRYITIFSNITLTFEKNISKMPPVFKTLRLIARLTASACDTYPRGTNGYTVNKTVCYSCLYMQ